MKEFDTFAESRYQMSIRFIKGWREPSPTIEIQKKDKTAL